ncbi:hypothetical protein LEP1GSC084_2035 [Leptospira interrogans serovar Medanensis str. L0448]|nr:hypothetical protein [Leptospira weilii]EKR83040.1 hypothetical protein LEP1GSC099_4300 [Leptospira interrogans str. UI 08452]EMN34065.1 hypothetical protein LEP1GSC084_2035 [Leptospira interrogans serovar Medanensis str. L0448]EMN39980.1 hypothetical protein LEP1GSC085_0847 [Leptospira interrogans str. L0996]EMO95689.1 hypothetical protein LEP1GSC109_2296 [Leptospira interrogans str. UI 13372]
MINEDKSKVIQFEELGTWSVKKSNQKPKCNHDSAYIVEGSPYLQCQTCEEDLDPIWFMTRIADQEQLKEWRVKRLTDRINDLTQEIENRNRVKCEHCGKFTKIFK